MLILSYVLFGMLVVHQTLLAAREGQTFLRFFILSVLVRAAILVAHHYGSFSVVDTGMDTEAFKLMSITYFHDYSVWELVRFWEISSQLGTYPIFLALLYHVFGVGDPIIGIFLNFLAYGYALILINRTRRLLVSLDKAGEFIFYIVVFTYPLAFFYSVILLRESLFVLACAASTYFLAQTWSNPNYRLPFVSFFGLNCLVSILHPGNLLFFAVVSALIAIRKMRTRLSGAAPVVLLATVIVVAAGTLVEQRYFGGYFTQYATTGDPLEKYLANMEQANINSIARYPKPYTGDLVQDLTLHFVEDLTQFMFTPYVFPPTNFLNSSIPRFVSSFYVTLIILGATIFAFRSKNRGMVRLLLFVLIVSVLLYTLGSIDYFQAGRHRTKFFPIIAILSAYVIVMVQHWFLPQTRSRVLNGPAGPMPRPQ